ncbi:D-alanine--D-alanine ligase family protein [Actinoplanes sp. NPDC023714]|uniref:D-alanine--D-alanine ligase family protein n=1 Tax=Actinoplanes sp. NPDC023714 TaxID=3154322 RepID=UPI0033EC42CD
MAVLFGGQNTEHAVSVSSAAGVVHSLDRSRYRVTPVRIGADGRWAAGPETPEGPVDEAVLRALTPDSPSAGSVAESLFEALGLIMHESDVVFPVLHGMHGEDGTVQSLLEHAGIPYVGSDVLASATSMDKEFTKKILAAEGVAVAPSVTLRHGARIDEETERRLGLPVFVKPARGGSSIGVSRVDDWAALPAAVATARLCDPKVLVESAVPGREIDVGVLEMPDGRLIASPPLEIRVDEAHGFFDYQAKYQKGITEFTVPAVLDPATTARLQQEAVRVFRTLGCSGLLRVDFFLAPDGTLTVNEVNTMPGMTSMSQFPRMWQAAGIAYPDLLDILIGTALRSSRSTGALAS